MIERLGDLLTALIFMVWFCGAVGVVYNMQAKPPLAYTTMALSLFGALFCAKLVLDAVIELIVYLIYGKR